MDIPNLGRLKDDRDKDYDPAELCDHCRVKLAAVLIGKSNYGSRDTALFEFGDHMFEVKCLR